MRKRNYLLRVFLAGIAGLFLLKPTLMYGLDDGAGCQWCKRSGSLSEVANSHVEEIEKELKEHADCVDSHIPPDSDPVYFTDDPILTNALRMCEHLDPGEKYGDAEWMRALSIVYWMKNALDSDCFDLYLKYPAAEYSFTGTFEVNLEGVTMDVGSDSYPSGRPALSRFTLDLYYEGEDRELVRSWQTLASTNSANVQTRKMFKNSASPLLQDLPMQEIFRDFEKTPQSCEIERPEDIEVLPGEVIQLNINRFQDGEGRKSREFNRIVVQADKGTILNGFAAGSPKQKAFKVGDGSVIIEYEAPDECGKDTIRVFNSCDISRRKPMSQTSKREDIGKLNVEVGCYDVTLTITKRVSVTGQAEDEGTTPTWDVSRKSMERREVERATVTVGLDFENVTDMWIFGEMWAYYTPKAVKLSAFSVDHMDRWYDYGHHKKTNVGFETTVVKTGRLSAEEKVRGPSVPMVALIYDRETKEPKRVVLAVSSIPYKLDWTEKHQSSQWGGDNPPPPKDEERTSVINKTFELAPVGESSEDPATGMEIYPDFDVAFGDGVNTFGGHGKKEYTYACRSIAKVPGEECRYEETYRWDLLRVKKK